MKKWECMWISTRDHVYWLFIILYNKSINILLATYDTWVGHWFLTNPAPWYFQCLLIIMFQHISSKLPFPLGRSRQVTISGSNSWLCSKRLFHVCSFICKAFPIPWHVFLISQGFSQHPRGSKQSEHLIPSLQMRKPRHKSEEICSVWHSHSPDGAAGQWFTWLPTQRKEALSPAGASQRLWLSPALWASEGAVLWGHPREPRGPYIPSPTSPRA